LTRNPAKRRKLKKVRLMVYLDPEQDERLRLLHEVSFVPTSVRIRQAIDMVLDKYETEFKKRGGNA
jgi:hypothetical protein